MIQSFHASIYAPLADTVASLIAIPRSRPADVMLLAIAGQESRWTYRKQVGGPARGFWQFEKGGGVAGVLTHPATAARARSLCSALRIDPDTASVYDALAYNDALAIGFARLLLWSDPKPLPTEAGPGWDCYLRNWRPGKPHAETWADRWDSAMSVV